MVKAATINRTLDLIESQLGEYKPDNWNEIRPKIFKEVTEKPFLNRQPSTFFLGAWDGYWLSFYDFGRKIGIKYESDTEERLDAYVEFARTCGVSYLYKDVSLVSDRPDLIQFDANRRLHNETGPALRYRDGYAVYVWKGIKIQKSWIETPLNIEQVLREKNAENRRILVEIYSFQKGPNKLIADADATLLHEDKQHGRSRKLYEIFGLKYLHVINGSLEPDGSRREFLLGANPESVSVNQAVAMSYGRPVRKYSEATRS